MRVEYLQAELARRSASMLLAPGDDLRYIAGWSPYGDERLTFLVVSPLAAAIVVPTVNAEEAEAHLPQTITVIRFTDEQGPQSALEKAWLQVKADHFTPFISDDARFDHVRAVMSLSLSGDLQLASQIVASMRMRKSAEEIAHLRESQAINDQAMRAAYTAMQIGMTENELADVIRRAFVQHGADREAFIIVAAGDNSAHPHHTPGDRVLTEGPVLLDIGCYKNGYASDMTRMAWIGTPSAKFLEVHRAVDAAVKAGRSAARVGALAQDIDRATRSTVAQAGYGPQFVHRTGHGIGLSVHEPPSIVEGNSLVIEAGMAFSIEPGIYLPGEFGVRLEEVAVVSNEQTELLSKVSREIWVKPVSSGREGRNGR